MPRRIVTTMCSTLMLSIALAGALVLSACSQGSVQEPVSESPPEPAPSVTISLADDASESLLVTNKTGLAITGIAVRTTGSDADFGVNLLSSGKSWPDGELAEIRYAADQQGSAAAAAQAAPVATSPAPDATNPDEGESEVQLGDIDASSQAQATLRQSYDIKLTFADGSVRQLHSLALSPLYDASLCIDDDLAYLAFSEDGREVSTLENERAAQAAVEEAAAQAAAEEAAAQEAAQAAAEEAAAEEAAAQAAAEEAAAQAAAAQTATAQQAAPPPSQQVEGCLPQ